MGPVARARRKLAIEHELNDPNLSGDRIDALQRERDALIDQDPDIEGVTSEGRLREFSQSRSKTDAEGNRRAGKTKTDKALADIDKNLEPGMESGFYKGPARKRQGSSSKGRARAGAHGKTSSQTRSSQRTQAASGRSRRRTSSSGTGRRLFEQTGVPGAGRSATETTMAVLGGL